MIADDTGGLRPLPQGARWLLLGAGLLLALVLIVVMVPLFASDTKVRIKERLADILPVQAKGWIVQALDVAQSEEMRSAVERILRYDDVVFRSYRKGMIEVQIYAAYWKPGSVPYGQAGVHTPDTCWVNAGWEMQEKVSGHLLKCGEGWLKPVESRRFRNAGQDLHVMFWHVVGDGVDTYDQYGWRGGVQGFLGRLPLFLQDLRRYGLNLAQEQLFVRVSANRPFGELLTDEDFVSLLGSLRPLGVWESSAGRRQVAPAGVSAE